MKHIGAKRESARRKYAALLFASSLWLWTGTYAATNDMVNLPGYIALPVTNVVFNVGPPQNFFGDGPTCSVVQSPKKKIKQFIQTNAEIDKKWLHGKLSVRKRHLGVLEWLERWIKVDGIYEELDQVINFEAIKKRNLHYRVEYQEDQTDMITNARMWILLPKRELIIYICYDT